MKLVSLSFLMIFTAALFTGCQMPSQSRIKDEPFVIDNTYRTAAPSTQPKPGSIYRGVNSNSNFLGDHRARAVGDIVIVKILESTKASEKATTDTKRNSGTTAGIPNFFGLESNMYPSSITPTKFIDASTKNDFSGSGETTRDGSLTGTITARVVDVLPNGNLAIEGKREISLNNEKTEILVQGIVRPRDLAYDNSVYSPQIADAKIIYTGLGVVGEKQRPGWLARIVDVVWPF